MTQACIEEAGKICPVEFFYLTGLEGDV
jgi:hypothetical protein